MDRRTALASLLCLPLTARAGLGAPVAYVLDTEESTVTFTFRLLGTPTQGTMPVSRADLRIDFADLRRTEAQVTLNAAGARTGLIFATEALKGSSVLDTARYPTIRFTSRRVTPTAEGAQITGDVTIRDVTGPLTLDGRIFRRRGSEEGDLSRLSVWLSGSVDRRVFGAAGHADVVQPQVDLDIRALIRRAG